MPQFPHHEGDTALIDARRAIGGNRLESFALAPALAVSRGKKQSDPWSLRTEPERFFEVLQCLVIAVLREERQAPIEDEYRRMPWVEADCGLDLGQRFGGPARLDQGE